MSGKTSHERSDANAFPLFVSGAVIVVVMAGGLWVSKLVEQALDSEAAERSPGAHPMADYRQAPASPLLQADTSTELRGHVAAEQARADGYGWVDPVDGVVSIPVDRAAELVLAEGLPSRTEGARAEGEGR
jgi:hypothetical protein